MFGFELTEVWRATLSSRSEIESLAASRAVLRQGYLAIRQRAAILAAEIARDAPQMTVHDVTHADALWETASLIAGPDYALSPPEAFVLGCAFLIHDLAMSRVAYPPGDNLNKSSMFNDLLAMTLSGRLGRLPSKEEIANADGLVKGDVERQLIRLNHAKQAEQLPVMSWEGPAGAPCFLIEDEFLREAYGTIIGRISHSHWWPVDRVGRELKVRMGAPGGFPSGWEVDPLKLASLLRVADASHLDERRAPTLLLAMRNPTGSAKDHWLVQNRLFQPRKEADRLVFTSKRPFTLEEASAWWLCFDLLNTVDRELRQVDALLLDLGRPRFAVRAVANAESPERLSEVVHTDGWTPVDAHVTVTDVVRLARNLGGESLYGEYVPAVPLRELIQNASDAIRARRILQDWSTSRGVVVVRLGRDSEGEWIEVEDNGTGMSQAVLAGPLLDFGQSYWGSELMMVEMPGLMAKGFQPAGQYGIGFFSVFMWGEHIRVVTRRFDEAMSDTRALEFGSGLARRPIIRRSDSLEYLSEGGTLVRVWLKDEARSEHGLFASIFGAEKRNDRTLAELCGWLCPTLDVDLFCQETEKEQRQQVLSASDWTRLSGRDLVARILPSAGSEILDLAVNLRPLTGPSGEVIGRAYIFEEQSNDISPTTVKIGNAGLVTVGGLRSNSVDGIAGVLLGRPMRAARDFALPLVEQVEVKRWAEEQADLLRKSFDDPYLLSRYATIVRGCTANPEPLPVALGQRGWMTIREISEWRDCPEEILLVSERHVWFALFGGRLALKPNVLVVPVGREPVLWAGPIGRAWPLPSPHYMKVDERGAIKVYDLEYPIIDALAVAWRADRVKVLTSSNFGFDKEQYEVAHHGPDVVRAPAFVIRRPHVTERD